MSEATLTLPEADGLPEQIDANEQMRRQRLFERIQDKLAAERQEDLDDMFHVDPTFATDHPEEAAALKEQFLKEKQGLNVGECFALSLTAPYFGLVHMVKLASTDHSGPDESQQMFRETNDLIHWLKTYGPLKGRDIAANEHVSEVIGDDVVRKAVKDGEDPGDGVDRAKSGRWMEYEFFDDEDGDPDHRVAIIRRIRPLVDVNAPLKGEPCNILLYKETVFTIKATLLRELLLREPFISPKVVAMDHHVYPEAVKNHHQPIGYQNMVAIERWLYTPEGDRPGIERHRIHTAIYSAVLQDSVRARIMDT